MSGDIYQQRRARLSKEIGSAGVEILAAGPECIRYRDVHYPYRPDSDLRYLCGFPEPESILVLAPGREDGECLLFCRPRDPERELWAGRRAGVSGAVQQYGVDEAFPIAEFEQRLPDLMDGREQVFLALARHSSVQKQVMRAINALKQQQRRGLIAPHAVLDLEDALHDMRLRKQPEEIALMRRAAEVSAAALCRAMRSCRAGMMEYQIAAEVHHELERNGMTPAYGSIVGGGANACVLHYIENTDELRDGDLLLIDAGAECEGYCADITRTFPVNGRFSGPQKALYEVVLKAQLDAIAAARPGADWNAPHRAAVAALTEGLMALGLLQGSSAAELIESEAYKRFYMHSTGHWLGMDVHDVGAYKVDGQWRPLEAGMVLTIEPGLYIAPDSEGVDPAFLGIGIRIEDDVLITETGNEVLTSGVPKAVADIEALMAAAA